MTSRMLDDGGHETPNACIGKKEGAFRRPQKKQHKDLPRPSTVVGKARVPASRRAGVTAYSSSGNSPSSASENTGPSTHTYFGPTLQRPQMPMPHFMRFSSVV